MTPGRLLELDFLAYPCARFEDLFENGVLSALEGLTEPELWVLAGMFYARGLLDEALWVADYAQAVHDGPQRPDPRLFMRQGENGFKESA